MRNEFPRGSRSVQQQQLSVLSLELFCQEVADQQLPDFAAGADLAFQFGMLGIFQLGLESCGHRESVNMDTLRLRTEFGAALAARSQTIKAMEQLHEAGIHFVVFKGFSVAERLWPEWWMRPPGDLDILIDEKHLETTLIALARSGFHVRAGDAAGRWRPALGNVDAYPETPGVAVDVHTRLFRCVGRGIRTKDVMERAVPDSVLGVPAQRMEAADEILYLMIHAANHGNIHPKWMLDLYSAAMHYRPEVWKIAAERAKAAGVCRAWWSVWRLLNARMPQLGDAALPRPGFPASAILPQIVQPGRARTSRCSGLRGYALSWALEDSAHQRRRKIAGMLERKLRAFFHRKTGGSLNLLRNQRWIASRLKKSSDPIWLMVQGGSMSPSLIQGDRILVRACDEIAAGDVVILKSADRLVVHRVIRMTSNGMITRGDSALFDDFPVSPNDVLGKVIAVASR